MALNIVALTDRPELAPAVAEWLLDEFRHALSPSHDEQVVALYLMRLCFTLCGTWAMLHARLRDRIRKNGKISGFGARAEAEGLVCRARRSWLDRLVGQPRCVFR